MVKFNGALYSYVHNLQGDVVGIVDNAGSLAVEYKYDAWGKPTLVRTLTTAYEALAELNPFRYRGYVYDEETGLYYLRSRYYVPQYGRFPNTDILLKTGRKRVASNSFTYCMNRPIRYFDPDGYFWEVLEEGWNRIKHVANIAARIVSAPFKNITASVGGGIGLGVRGSANVGSAKVTAEAVLKDADIVVLNSEGVDLVNQSSASAELSVGLTDRLSLGYSGIVGEEHSYCDEDCTCDFWTSTFKEKMECEANEEIVDNSELTVGVGGGLYLGIGFEFDISLDVAALCEEYVDIWNDALSYE